MLAQTACIAACVSASFSREEADKIAALAKAIAELTKDSRCWPSTVWRRAARHVAAGRRSDINAAIISQWPARPVSYIRPSIREIHLWAGQGVRLHRHGGARGYCRALIFSRYATSAIIISRRFSNKADQPSSLEKSGGAGACRWRRQNIRRRYFASPRGKHAAAMAATLASSDTAHSRQRIGDAPWLKISLYRKSCRGAFVGNSRRGLPCRGSLLIFDYDTSISKPICGRAADDAVASRHRRPSLDDYLRLVMLVHRRAM